jgi:hypothetical protein
MGVLEETDSGLTAVVAVLAVAVPWACWPAGLDVVGDLGEGAAVEVVCWGGYLEEILGEGAVAVEGLVVVPLAGWPVESADLKGVEGLAAAEFTLEVTGVVGGLEGEVHELEFEGWLLCCLVGLEETVQWLVLEGWLLCCLVEARVRVEMAGDLTGNVLVMGVPNGVGNAGNWAWSSRSCKRENLLVVHGEGG